MPVNIVKGYFLIHVFTFQSVQLRNFKKKKKIRTQNNMFQVKMSQKFCISTTRKNLKKLKKILEHQINQSKMFPKKGRLEHVQGWDMQTLKKYTEIILRSNSMSQFFEFE
jgi:hypothetical protein